MATIREVACDASGNPYWVPWPQAIPDEPKLVTPPTISGTVGPDQTVTALGGTFTPGSGLTKSFRWELLSSAGAVVETATGGSYKIPASAATGKLKLYEDARGVGGLVATGSAEAAITGIPGLPVFTRAPVIGGGDTVGEVLTCADGAATGSPAPTITRQWMRDGANISGATGTSYTIVSGDIGKAITCRNTATNTIAGVVHTATSDSASVTPVAATAPSFNATPSISGSAVAGNVLTAVNGTAIGNPVPTLAGQWRRDGTAISGATGTTYTTVEADVGKVITYRNTATNIAGSATADSGGITITAGTGVAPSFTSAPSISGNTAAGQVLTCADGAATGSPAPTITRQWLKNGTAISGATGSTYTTVVGDVGAAISCRNTATNTAGSATSTSGTITIVAAGVAPTFTVQPTISYNATSGKFTCTAGTATGNPAPTLTYLWHWADTATGTLTARSQGATTTPNEWTPDVNTYGGKFIACQVTAANGVTPNAVVMTSRILRPAQEGFIDNTPALTGNSAKGNTLTIGGFTYYGNPTITYEWYRGTTKLSTTTTTRVTGNDDVGETITVKVILTYASGATFNATSNGITVTEGATGTVVNVATLAALRTEILKADAAGKTFVLAAGTHTGEISVSGQTWSPAITIRGAADASEAVRTLTGDVPLGFTNCDGFHIIGFNVVHSARDTRTSDSGAMSVTGVSGELVAKKGTKAVNINKCKNFSVKNCLSSNSHEGFRIDNSENAEISYNTVKRNGMDNLRMYGYQKNVKVHHNYVYETWINLPNIKDNGIDTNTRHPDGNQYACNPSFSPATQFNNTEGDDPCENMDIHHNWLESIQYDGTDTNDFHGIFFANRRTRDKKTNSSGAHIGGQELSVAACGHDDIQIWNNMCIAPASQGGVTIEGMKNSVIERNVFRRPANTGTAETDAPGLCILGHKYDNVICRNNVAQRSSVLWTGKMSGSPSSLSGIAGLSITGNTWDSNTALPTGWEALVTSGTSRNIGQWAPA